MQGSQRHGNCKTLTLFSEFRRNQRKDRRSTFIELAIQRIPAPNTQKKSPFSVMCGHLTACLVITHGTRNWMTLNCLPDNLMFKLSCNYFVVVIVWGRIWLYSPHCFQRNICVALTPWNLRLQVWAATPSVAVLYKSLVVSCALQHLLCDIVKFSHFSEVANAEFLYL